MNDGSGTVVYAYDDADRLTDATRSDGGAGLNGSFHYAYDDAGNITSRTYPDSSSHSQVFDDDGRLTSITTASLTTSFAYDPAGNLTTTTLPSGNGYSETRGFDRAGRLTTVDNAKQATSLSKFSWTLDPAGNPTKVQTTRGANDTYDVYEYDTRDRVTGSCFDVGSSATDCSGATNAIGYAYDKVSNRTQEVRAGNVGNTGTIDASYNDADQLTATSKSGQQTDYTYDANGNQATAGERSFSYDLANRLASTTQNGTTTEYAYDGDGQRASATTNGGTDTRFLWDNLADSGIPELALEQQPDGTLVRRYVNGPDGAVSFTDPNATSDLHHDPLGTITDVTDATGTPQWRYTYDAYGEELTETDVSGSAPDNPLRYTGQYYDPATSNYHLRARQYDPGTGRFQALDPIENPQTSAYYGAYVYVNGRPTIGVDPLGLFCDDGFVDCAKDVGKGYVDFEKGVAEGEWDVVVGLAKAPREIFSGKAGTQLGNLLYDANEAGGPLMAASAVAYSVTAPFFACGEAIKGGGAEAIGRRCTVAAATAVTLGATALCLTRGLAALAEAAEGRALLSRLASEETGQLGPGAAEGDALPTQITGATERLTNAQAADLAKYNGYRSTNQFIQGERVFTNGKTYIVQDNTSHVGGTWKIAKSPGALASKTARTATSDALLTPIGD